MAVINRVPELVAAKFGGKDNINMQQVATGTDLTYATAASWVKGRVERADFPVLEKWCKYLKVEVGDILKYVPDDQTTN